MSDKHTYRERSTIATIVSSENFWNFAMVFVFAIGFLIYTYIDHIPVKQDETKSMETKGSIETSISVAHLDGQHDILTTKHVIWAQDTVVITIISDDTLPSLGQVYADLEDSTGSTQGAYIPRDYEIYLTVK